LNVYCLLCEIIQMPRDLEHKKEWSKNYYKEHREYLLKLMENWRKTHKDKKRELDKKYTKEHKEERKEYLHRPDIKIRNIKSHKKWIKTHPEEARKLWDRQREERQKLGHIPLNNYFEGSHGHHINEDFIIYIPEELHTSIWHCLKTGRGMEEINIKAFEWFEMNIGKLP